MDKFRDICFIILFVILAYIFLMAFWPAIMAAHEVGNATMMENPMIGCFTEAQAGYRWAPLALWFVPAAIGTAAVVIRLKFVDSSE